MKTGSYARSNGTLRKTLSGSSPVATAELELRRQPVLRRSPAFAIARSTRLLAVGLRFRLRRSSEGVATRSLSSTFLAGPLVYTMALVPAGGGAGIFAACFIKTSR